MSKQQDELIEQLSRENLLITAKTLRALDIFSGELYRNKHEKEVNEKSHFGDSDVATFVDHFLAQTPSYIFLMNGHSYSVLRSILANMLSACGLDALTDVVVKLDDAF